MSLQPCWNFIFVSKSQSVNTVFISAKTFPEWLILVPENSLGRFILEVPPYYDTNSQRSQHPLPELGPDSGKTCPSRVAARVKELSVANNLCCDATHDILGC